MRHVAALCVVLACARPTAAEPIEEILVTARKVSEPLAEVPMSMDAFARRDLETQAIDSLQSLIARTPGLYYESSFGGLFSQPTMRAMDAGPNNESNVGVFVDGVYQASRFAMDVDPLDVERIEVVRGPQSTLFGHDTFAGAIQYVSAAPTEQPDAALTFDGGSDSLTGVRTHASGPLIDSALLGRLAVGVKRADGTDDNDAPGNETLGGYERTAAVITLATADAVAFDATLVARISRNDTTQPAIEPFTYPEYNCGSVDAISGAWSYYCGDLPTARDLTLSSHIPDSRNETRQVSLELAVPWLGGVLESQSSYYRGETDLYRDLDATRTGERFGVCTLGVNCTGTIGVPRFVDGLVDANTVLRLTPQTEEWSQEVRFRAAAGDRLDWMLGATAYWTTTQERTEAGVERGSLGPSQRLTAYQPTAPLLVGPLATTQNAALVDDPNRRQVTQTRDLRWSRSLALFGLVDYAVTDDVRARAELRASRKRIDLENRVTNFTPGFYGAIGAEEFDDVTPRLSLDWAASDALRAYISAAEGSRSGGINPVPGLDASEQSFDPESNWTYEVGLRWADPAGHRFAGTYYVVDEQDTQLTGFADTPGITNLITRNTEGREVNGVEISADLRAARWLGAELDYAYMSSEYRGGSDDPGGRRFCGLTATISTSTFCEIGPSRSGNTTQLVPYIDGNQALRVPRTTWHAAVVLDGAAGASTWQWRVDANGQDDVFERSIAGARYGARMLVDTRLTWTQPGWTLALWGRNLTDEDYIRNVTPGPPTFYQTVARPLGLLYGDGRRIGATITWSASP